MPTLPSFADIFSAGGPRAILTNLALRRLLSAETFPCIANHSLNASLSVATALHYPKSRIVPWDWGRLDVAPTAKNARTGAGAEAGPLTAFFAGNLVAAKGIGDCLNAVALLARQGLDLRFAFAGPGDADAWRTKAAALGIETRVDFPGLLPHDEIRRRMRAADIVVVPSRHDYAEGLPNTIYEALAARSPLVLSDHPAFAGRLKPDAECLVFRAGDPADLAACIARLAEDRALYARLSQNAAAAHESLYVGTEWTTLVRLFLDDPTDRSGWVRPLSLSELAPT